MSWMALFYAQFAVVAVVFMLVIGVPWLEGRLGGEIDLIELNIQLAMINGVLIPSWLFVKFWLRPFIDTRQWAWRPRRDMYCC